MRRKPELLILAGLLVGAMAFVLWYVIDRRAKPLAGSPVALAGNVPTTPGPTPAAPVSPSPAPVPAMTPPAAPASMVATTAPNSDATIDLAKHDRQTIDFSSGQPVVKNTAADKAAIDSALKDIESAEKETTFEASKKEPPRK